MKKSKISLALFLMLVVVTVTNTVLAATASLVDTSKKGSVTITALSQLNGSTDTVPLKDVKYALYKVDEVAGTTITTVDAAENYIKGKTPVNELVTGDNGKVAFTNLDLGRYYAKVVEVPIGTTEVPESFLVDVPMTNQAGNGWIYDIDVQPKVQVASGNAVLTKVDGADKPIQGVVFKVQVSTEEDVWEDYTPEGATTVLSLTTDENGQVKLEDFPITLNQKDAKFRLVEMSTPDDGYIIDNANLDYVYAESNGKTVVVHKDGTKETAADVAQLKMVNEKPTIAKKAGENLDVESVNVNEPISFTVTADVPSVIADMSVFKITDTLSDGLTGRTNLVVKGAVESGFETIPESAYEKTETDKVLTLEFYTTEIDKYSAIIVTYDVKLDMNNVVLGTAGNTNTAELTYTNKVDVDGTTIETDVKSTDETVKVVTGGVKIHKVNADGANLSGAKFKIATSEANAQNGVFVQDEIGDIEVTTADDGYALIKGIAYNDDETARDYWLVETQAPTFVENGETKAYTLLGKPVKVSVSGTSHTVDVEVINKKPINLPLTGGMGTIILTVLGVAFIVIARSIKKQKVNE